MRAFIGDIHACVDELKKLVRLLHKEGVAEIYHAGDLVDRGPDNHGVIEFLRREGIDGVQGNHDAGIIGLYDRFKRTGELPRNPDKKKTIQQITDEDVAYMQSLPFLRIFDDIKTVLVHGGLYPKLSWEKQPENAICRLQLIHPDKIGMTKWFNVDKKGVTEEEYRAQGWVRWYEVWDHEYNVVFGHSRFVKPFEYKTPGGGTAYGIDTGSCFGGYLTALILPEGRYVSVECKPYFQKGGDDG